MYNYIQDICKRNSSIPGFFAFSSEEAIEFMCASNSCMVIKSAKQFPNGL
jgi:hypothetical protein